MVLAVLVGAAAVIVSGGAGAAPTPRLVVPERARTGDVISVSVFGCAGDLDLSWIRYRDPDSSNPLTTTSGPAAGQRRSTFTVPDYDLIVRAICDGVILDGGLVDVATTTTPTVDVSPQTILPGETATVTVTGCDEQPSGIVSFEYDDVAIDWAFVETSPGTWTQSFRGGQLDLFGIVSCPGWINDDDVVIDVDAPTMFFGLYYGPFGTQDPPTEVIGKDCPRGTTAAVEIRSGDSMTTTEAALNPYGDWAVDLPATTAIEGATVRASCGDVIYDSITYEGSGPTTTTPVTTGPPTTTEPSVAAPTVAPAKPALPRSGSPDYTG